MEGRRLGLKLLFAALTVFLFLAGTAFAAHPLITDDTGTQGRGNSQLELNAEFEHEDEDGSEADTSEVAATLSYGIAEKVDLVLNLPYQFIRVKERGETASEDGISDISIEAKWRFFEKDGLSFALKPGISLPTGDEDKGLGAGKVAYSAFFIATKKVGPWAFHVNLGYMRNENDADERKNLWHASAAAQVQATKNLIIAGNIGIEENTDRNADTDPAFILGGVIYSLTEDLDVDFGVKAGLTGPEADYSLLAGLAWRF
jgi:hypothetical protein